MRILHAEQQYIYHKPIRPGEKLTVNTKRGNSWEKEGRRCNTMSFSETITGFRNVSDELVMTVTSRRYHRKSGLTGLIAKITERIMDSM